MSFPEPSQREVAIGVFQHRDKAEAAVDDLRNAGFPPEDIGIAAKRTESEWGDYEAAGPGAVVAREADGDVATDAASGAVAGAATGAGLGGLWALGIAAGLLPAIGPVVAGGLLGSILASAAAGAAAGGLLGALVGLGFSDEEARYYEGEFHSGRTIVTVRTRGRYDEAVRILWAHGAFDMSRRPDVVASGG